MPVIIRQIAHGTADYAAAVNLRRAVLRTPLGLDFTSAQLAAEAGDTHLAAFEGDDLVATVLISPYADNAMKLRQMAVDDTMQGQGLGAKVLAAAEAAARGTGAQKIILAARVTAQDFYARYGYTADGDVYEEVTIPHITMHKSL